ncbi:MAG: hypothetical protein M1837_001573 [Sclerophora amabilis]|nr:MAG: hypothetical protein M1837_001573 [Sclerophora amabilis]
MSDKESRQSNSTIPATSRRKRFLPYGLDSLSWYPFGVDQYDNFPILPDHPLLPHWPVLEKEILEALQQSPVSWFSLDVLRLRRRHDPRGHKETTVCVTARKHDDQAWGALQARIETICQESGQADLGVKLSDGHLWPSRGPEPPRPLRTFAIQGDHPLVPRWACLKKAIVATLEQTSLS